MDQLYYGALAKRDDDKRIVEGYATSEAIDASGEIIKMNAVKAALDDFMRHPALRVMHQLVAAGKVTKAVIDKKGLYITAKVVDDDAWKKVKEAVLRGFSVGGKVTGRDPNNSKIITGIRLDEISLVDRPQNPDAVIDTIKAGGARTVESAGSVKSVDELWESHHKFAMEVDAMPDGEKKWAAREEVRSAAEKILAIQMTVRNETRRRLRTPDPVRHLG